MRIVCPNCKTVHEITNHINKNDNMVIKCTACGKNIKLQFCPYCNAFYSITFSNIKSGNYTYKCKKCHNSFKIKFSDDEQIIQKKEEKKYDNQQTISIKKSENKTENKTIDENEVHDKPKYESVETFSISELLKFASEAFTVKKIIVSAIGITSILVFLQIWGSIMNFVFISGTNTSAVITGSIINILPVIIIFSFYILSATIVSKITLNHIHYSRNTETDEIVRFTIKRGPGIIGANVILLFAVSLLLIIFGNIPLLGPIFFSLAFLPIYLLSMAVLILSFIGLWFYPPIAAHDENGVLNNIKDLLLFMKKHKLSIIFMILVIFLITVIAFAVIFIIHISVFSFTTSISQVFIGQDVLMTLSSIPGKLVKASQTTLMGIKSGLFKELYQSLQVTHHIAGFILGIIFFIITIFLLSIPISIASTVSTHIYVLMEKKNSIDDKTKALVLFILIMLIVLIILVNKII